MYGNCLTEMEYSNLLTTIYFVPINKLQVKTAYSVPGV